MIVDSRPSPAAPSSRMSATLSPRSSCTWAASVGETWPERLALGAATGLPNALSRACAVGWEGTRIATDSSPARARSHTGQAASAGTIRVRGPGQKAAASRPGFLAEIAEGSGGGEVDDMRDQRG